MLDLRRNQEDWEVHLGVKLQQEQELSVQSVTGVFQYLVWVQKGEESGLNIFLILAMIFYNSKKIGKIKLNVHQQEFG